MASWGFPLVSKSGRIYVLWNQYQGIDDVVHQHTGTMDCCHMMIQMVYARHRADAAHMMIRTRACLPTDRLAAADP